MTAFLEIIFFSPCSVIGKKQFKLLQLLFKLLEDNVMWTNIITNKVALDFERLQMTSPEILKGLQISFVYVHIQLIFGFIPLRPSVWK